MGLLRVMRFKNLEPRKMFAICSGLEGVEDGKVLLDPEYLCILRKVDVRGLKDMEERKIAKDYAVIVDKGSLVKIDPEETVIELRQ